MMRNRFVHNLIENVSHRREHAAQERRHLDDVKAFVGIASGARALSEGCVCNKGKSSGNNAFTVLYGNGIHDYNGEVAAKIFLSSFSDRTGSGSLSHK